MIKREYGWIRDLPDQRDLLFTSPKIKLPKKIDLRPSCPPVVQQENLGSCTANAIASCYWYVENGEFKNAFYPSRLFIYYNERKREHSIKEDRGAMIRTGMKTIAKEGVCPETEWEYITSNFAVEPPKKCYKHAKEHQVLKYSRVGQSLKGMKSCLASGYPFVFGFAIYPSFETDEVARTGIVPMPKMDERLVGGHAVMAVGYDDETCSFIILNSWGEDWGIKGYFMLPYEFMLSPYLTADLWTIRLVEGD